MFTDASPLRIGILGSDGTFPNERHGCGLWPAGNAAAVTAAGATPVPLSPPSGRSSLDYVLNTLDGLLISEPESAIRPLTDGGSTSEWCHTHDLPTLAP